jgi:hypothetical protein
MTSRPGLSSERWDVVPFRTRGPVLGLAVSDRTQPGGQLAPRSQPPPDRAVDDHVVRAAAARIPSRWPWRWRRIRCCWRRCGGSPRTARSC